MRLCNQLVQVTTSRQQQYRKLYNNIYGTIRCRRFQMSRRKLLMRSKPNAAHEDVAMTASCAKTVSCLCALMKKKGL